MKTGKLISLSFNDCERLAYSYYKEGKAPNHSQLSKIYKLNTCYLIQQLYKIFLALYKSFLGFKLNAELINVANTKRNIGLTKSSIVECNKCLKDLDKQLKDYKKQIQNIGKLKKDTQEQYNITKQNILEDEKNLNYMYMMNTFQNDDPFSDIYDEDYMTATAMSIQWEQDYIDAMKKDLAKMELKIATLESDEDLAIVQSEMAKALLTMQNDKLKLNEKLLKQQQNKSSLYNLLLQLTIL